MLHREALEGISSRRCAGIGTAAASLQCLWGLQQGLKIRGVISYALLGSPLGLRNKRIKRAVERFLFFFFLSSMEQSQHHQSAASMPWHLSPLFQVVAVELISFIVSVFHCHRSYFKNENWCKTSRKQRSPRWWAGKHTCIQTSANNIAHFLIWATGTMRVKCPVHKAALLTWTQPKLRLSSTWSFIPLKWVQLKPAPISGSDLELWVLHHQLQLKGIWFSWGVGTDWQ